jgi:tRNA-2-methylthio-N6-dimethylallyladenosine synthase
MDGHLILYPENGDEISKIFKGNSSSAFVSLMRGCNRFCSYCIVPYVRGREKSRKTESILQECRMLADKGIKELMLLGQNVAAYGYPTGQLTPVRDESPFAELLKEICKIDGIERIRFTSPHPACFNDKLIYAIGELEKICDNVHLPLQSGSNSILDAMGRGYTSEEYLNIVKKLKACRTGITFSTDIIVGFPGETEKDFEATRNVMETVGFDNAFIFKFSPRTGTKAAEKEDNIPQKVKEERNALLLKVLKKTTAEHNSRLVGTTQNILVEGISKRNSERWYGRTTTNKVTVFTPYAGITPGDIINVTIDRATEMTLFGSVLNKD